MFLRSHLVAAALSCLFTAPSLAVVLEKLAALPHGWNRVGTPSSTSTIALKIGLQEQNLDKLESLIYAISTPGHPSYGNHMEGDDVAALLKPADETESEVLAWLKQAGISTVHSDGHWVTFATTVGTANKLLDTEFAYYENDGVTKLRTTHYSVPDSIAKHIDLISPTTYFGKTTAQAPARPAESSQLSSRQAGQGCGSLITPDCLKQIYDIQYTPSGKTNSTIGFGSFLNQSARTQDLQLFEKKYNIPTQSFSVELINGGTNDQSISNNHGEANLDVQYIVGISHPLPVVSFITGGSPPFVPNLDEPTAADNQNEPYLEYYQHLLAQPNSKLPQVISNSYGDDEQTVPQAYATRVCNMIGQLGLRGVSVLESSGDTGVGAACQSNDGKKAPQFTPQFPGTCPYITAVGGTQSIRPEVAWDAGSGGFSNYFSQPSYQQSAVSNYLQNGISPSTLAYYKPFFNSSGRGFPDVSAHSLTPDYSVYTNNAATLSGGTSAACPVFAAIIALLNDARLSKNLQPLGFLNPWLYSVAVKGGGLTDITRGGARGCTGTNAQTGKPVPGGSVIPYASWNATVGWDPVTGLGVPSFARLLSLATSG